MAQINWRNVAAVPLGNASSGIRDANAIFQSALESARRGVNTLDNSRRDRVNNAFRQRLMEFTDEKALGAALSVDPTLGLGEANARYLNDESLDLGLNRRRFLTGTNQAIQNLDENKYAFGRGVEMDADRDAATELVRQIRETQLFKDDARGAVNAAEGFSSRARELALRELGLGNGLVDGYGPTNAGFAATPESSAAPGSIGGSVGAPSLRIMNYEARASGFDTVPDDVQNLGQASDFALKVNEANKKRTGKPGSSAMGIYQITGSTMRSYAQKLYGDDWRNVNFDFAAQDRIAQQIFEDHKDSASKLSKQWVSLSKEEAEQVRKMPWEQARQIIAQKESNGNPAEVAQLLGIGDPLGDGNPATADPTTRAIAESQTQLAEAGKANEFTGAAVSAYRDNLDFTGNLNDAVGQLKQKEQFKDIPTGRLTGQIQRVMDKAKKAGWTDINEAQAAALWESSLREQAWYDNADVFNWFGESAIGSSDFFDDVKVNQSVLDGMIAEVTSGNIQDRAVALDTIQATSGERQQVAQKIEQLTAYLQQAQRRNLAPEVIRGIEQDLSVAQRVYEGLRQKQNANPQRTQYRGESEQPAPSQGSRWTRPASAQEEEQGFSLSSLTDLFKIHRR